MPVKLSDLLTNWRTYERTNERTNQPNWFSSI